MRWIIFNCLLLMSFIAAEPDGRQKRHFSFFKNLFSSTLFGGAQRESPEIVNSEPVQQYQLYQVPGFDDVFVKALPSAPILDETVANEPGELLKIQPFESYIGTKNSKDTLAAFQNVNNLLSTGIFDEEQTNLLRKTMVPMISGLNLPQENIGTVPVISELMPQVQTVAVNPSDEKVNLEESLKPKYSYNQVEVDLPVLEVTSDDNPEVIVNEEFDPTFSIPCIDQRIKEVDSMSSNSNTMTKTETSTGHYKMCNGQIGQYPNAINRFPPSEYKEPLRIDLLKPVHKKVPLSHPSASIIHVDEPLHVNQAEASKTKPVDSSDTIDISQTLGPIPPQYISSVMSGLNKPTSEARDTKPTYSNFAISANKDSVDQIPSHYAYTQASHDDPNAFSMVKEGNVLKTNVHTESPVTNPVDHNTPKTNATPVVKNISHTDETTVPLVKDKDSEAVESLKVPEEVPVKGTLAYYIYERENRNKPKPFSIVEADEHKNYENSPELIRYVYIPPDYDRLPEATNDEKTADKAPIDFRMSHPNNMQKKGDNFVTDVHNDSPSRQYVYIPPEIKTPVNSNARKASAFTTKEVMSSSEPEISSIKSAPENSSVLKGNGHISFKDNRVVVPHGKYVYHQSNPDGSSMSVKGNKDGVSVDVNEKPSKGRGDITDEI